MYVDCVYATMSKSTKQVPNHLKIAEESVVKIVFNHVICEVPLLILLPFLTVALHES